MCPKLIELLSWNGPTVHVCCFMLARASTKTFVSRIHIRWPRPKNSEKYSLAGSLVSRCITVCCRLQHIKLCICRRVSKSSIGICIRRSVIPPFCLCLDCISKWRSKLASFRLPRIWQRGRKTIYIYRAVFVVRPKKIQHGRPNFYGQGPHVDK